MMPVANRMTTVHAVADRNSRSASELARIGGGVRRYPSPRTVWMISTPSFLRMRPMKTSMVLESRSKS